jgi:RecA/RadA recombinase
MLPGCEAAAGLEGRNLRTQMDLPMFLNSLLRRWVGLGQVYQVAMVFVNQLREKPMAFGDPTYTPGGNALKFYTHVQVRMNRASKGGRLTDKGKVIGIQGEMTNRKNKVGGIERATVRYKILFDGPMEFMPSKKLSAAGDANNEEDAE